MPSSRFHYAQVIAFTPFAGLVAWAEDTVPLANYLSGEDKDSGAHKRYHPRDWNVNQCFALLKKPSSKSLRAR